MEPNTLRSQGNAALETREPDVAEKAYRALLTVQPTNIYALVGLGSASRLRGNCDEALRRFQEAAAIWPSHPWPLLEISGVLDALGLPDEAEATLRRALEFSPHHSHVHMALGRLLRRRRDHESAAEMFRGATKSEPTQTSAYVEGALELVSLGRQNDAIAMLDAGTSAGAEKIVIYRAKARILREGGSNEAALGVWMAALAEQPEQSAYKLEIAAEMSSLGRHANALMAYRAVLEDEQITIVQRCEAALSAARIARERKNEPLALGFLEQGAALDADHLRINCELGHLYRATGRFEHAERTYRKILEGAAASVSALGGFASLRRLLGDRDGALELFKKANQLDPNNEWIKLEYAGVLRESGQLDEAVLMLETIDRSSGMHTKARMLLGYAARVRGNGQRAVDFFEEAASTAADPTEALCQLLIEKHALGDVVEVKSAIARIFHRNPESYSAHLAEGLLRRAMGDRYGAHTAFLQAAAIKPMVAQPQLEIATDSTALGDLKAAAAAIEAALKIDPQDEAAWLKKGAYLAENGNIDAAFSLYEKLRSKRPTSVSAYLAPAQLLAEKGDFDRALGLLALARRNGAHQSLIDLREAAILRQQGFLDESYQLLSTAHAGFPHEFWPWYSRTSAAIELGYFETAEALLASPPHAADQEPVRLAKLCAQFHKARWALDAAIESFDTAIAADANDSSLLYERAKLKMITLDLPGARFDLVAYASLQTASPGREGRSANPSQTHVGQLYEEYVLDGLLSADLTALRGLTAEEQVMQFAGLERRFPDSTAVALGLMIALRRSGRFDLPPAPPSDLPARIPRLITQFWNDTEPPLDVRGLMNSWKISDPDFKIEIFDNIGALVYLREHCDAVIARAFSRAREPAQQADIFRLARLFCEGGYFIDADDRARGGLTGHVPKEVDFFAHQEDFGSIGNNVIGAVSRHPVVQLALQESVTAILRGDLDIIWLSTGPGLLTRSLARWLAADPEDLEGRVASVAVLTLAEMRRAAAMACHAAYKNTSRAWLRAAFQQRDKRERDRQ